MLNWTRKIPTAAGVEDVKQYDLILVQIVERNLRNIPIHLGRFLEQLGHQAVFTQGRALAWQDLNLEGGDTFVSGSDPSSAGDGQVVPVRIPVNEGSSDDVVRVIRIERRGAEALPMDVDMTWRDADAEPESRSCSESLAGQSICIPLPYGEEISLELKVPVGTPDDAWKRIEVLEFGS